VEISVDQLKFGQNFGLPNISNITDLLITRSFHGLFDQLQKWFEINQSVSEISRLTKILISTSPIFNS